MNPARILFSGLVASLLLSGCIVIPTAPGPERDDPDQPDDPSPTSFVVSDIRLV